MKEALERANIEGVSDEQREQLEAYCKLLWSWNERMNLTRHTHFDLFVRRDLLDSLQLAQLLEPNEEVLDIGTGGGVPGVLVAILRPDVQMSLCDSVTKKAKAVDEIVHELGLKIPVHATRVQDVLEDFTFDSLVARAVGPLPKLCQWLQDYWHCFGRLLAIKGPKWVEERGEARHRGLLKGIQLRRAASYAMPETFSESVILQLRRIRPGESEGDAN